MTGYGAAATRERQGWFLGLTGLQLALLLGAAVPVWLAMAVGRWAALLLLVPAWLVAAALITVPVRGWSAAQWLGVLVRHSVGAATGWTIWQSRAATGVSGDPAEADLPGILSGIRLHHGPPLPGSLVRPALIQDLASRTWAATARITHPGIGMADEQDRARMAAGLAELLESAAGAAQIHTLALQVRSLPDDGTARADWVRRHARPDEPRLSAEIHSQLDQALQAAAVRAEAFLTVVAREQDIGKDARRAGRGREGRARVLHGLLAEVEARLTGSLGCAAVSWLDAADLSVAIRTGFEPGDAVVLGEAALLVTGQETGGVPPAAAGPTTASTTLRSYRHGDWSSVAATIVLPRKGAVMGALARVLVPSTMGERRSMTVFFRPVAPRKADRRTGRAEMSATMGAEMRRRVGRVERAKERRASQDVRDTDEKLQRGRALVQVSSAVSVTVPASWDTHDHGRRLDASLRLCGFVPLALDGAHDAGFAAATIPLGVGLATTRRA